jgi:FtsP/CotA-like multicopper oxidase with cupredoxin domain
MPAIRTDSLRRPRGRRWRRVSCWIAVSLYWLGPGHADSVAFSSPNGSSVEPIDINDNRVAAGALEGGVLTIRLEARTGEWRPDGDADRGIIVRAFGEEGKPLQIPGPLIRVPKGTQIRAFVRNSLDSTLIAHGLSARGTAAADTVQVAPGTVREVRFTAGAPGTYYYWATTDPSAPVGGRGIDSQLSGALVVDPEATLGPPRDRIFVLGLWSEGTITGFVNSTAVLRFVINGKAWPKTERLAYTVGDTVRFRIVNVSAAPHPMHLHGFYFTVDSRGDGRADSTYAGTSPRWAVTERAAPGRTFALTWVPERPGTWMFHCHDNFHVLRNRPLDGAPLPPEHHMADVKNHAMEMMGGLVMGIEVRPQGTATVLASGDGPRRKLRLIARVDSANTADEPAYGYVLQDGRSSAPSRSPLLPGPTILLKRGEPVSITVVNELPEPTAVHWHGIELESYFDGVAGFSGAGTKLSPVIAPKDSFEARFTPPRSGTFIYHPHADEVRQQAAGLSGAIVVLDDPRRYDPVKDIVLLVSTPRRQADQGVVLLNGTSTPAPIAMRVGDRYRLRLINIHTSRPSMIARLGRDSTVLEWRAVAKDGMELAPDQATRRPAMQQMGNGEAFDFEFTPTSPGDHRFWVTTGANVLLVTMPIRVR